MHAAVLLFVAFVASGPDEQAAGGPQSIAADTTPGRAVTSGGGAPPAETAPPPRKDQPPEAKAADPPPAGRPGASESPSNGGQGHPPIAVPATAQRSPARVQVTLDSNSVGADFQAGLLASPQNPDQRIVPKVAILTDMSKLTGPSSLDIEVSGLAPFGELTVPLMYKGRQVETLRFHKAGLIVRTPADGTNVAHEKDGRLLLVVENPSIDPLDNIGVRVRFQDTDVCTAAGDQTSGPSPSKEGRWTWLSDLSNRLFGDEPVSCQPDATWTKFSIRPLSQVSLWVPTHERWFVDRPTGLSRSAIRKGVLTLRYFSGNTVAAEQNVPVEARFEPTTAHLGWSIVWTGFLLLLGALLFLVLRVSIPNYRRKKAMKDALNEARVATATISNGVDSQLRVLLRVERLVLDQRRREGWVLLPGFAELATRIEAGLATLTRKIALARRLDAAACRRESLLTGPVSPTRVDVIDRELTAACDGLKSDQLRDADWLFIQQKLEAADKALNELPPEEKEAFEALLSQRWQSIRDYFGQENDQGAMTLKVPEELEPMKACFPRASFLPKDDDADGRKWIVSMGVVRADLQLTALERLKDVQFFSPNPLSEAWSHAMTRLTPWLATPSIDNLSAARRLVQQLSEPVTVEEIVEALEGGRAEIEMDPQVVAPNQTVKLSVRFLDPRLNTAKLGDGVQCEWTFDAPKMFDAVARRQHRWPRWARLVQAMTSFVPSTPVTAPVAQKERGWTVHRYFEPGVEQQTLAVRFFRNGRELNIPSDILSRQYQKFVEPSESTSNRRESHEKWLRFGFQTVQMLAVLLVPLATLAITTTGDVSSGQWWDLVGIGFGSEAIRNILTGDQSTTTT